VPLYKQEVSDQQEVGRYQKLVLSKKGNKVHDTRILRGNIGPQEVEHPGIKAFIAQQKYTPVDKGKGNDRAKEQAQDKQHLHR
jgi:hypothetical protein